MQEFRKITFNFPEEEYIYLKMTCAKKKVKMKDFLTQAIIRCIEDCEDEWDRESLKEAKGEIKEKGTIPWEEMEKDLGWDKL